MERMPEMERRPEMDPRAAEWFRDRTSDAGRWRLEDLLSAKGEQRVSVGGAFARAAWGGFRIRKCAGTAPDPVQERGRPGG